MTSQELGNSFEKITHDFFIFLFEELKIQVNNNWVQKAGYQFGFDVGFEVAILNDDFFKRGIFIECKNYEKSILEQAHLLTKIMQFHRSDYEKKDSIFIFLSPKVDLSRCTQDSNPKQLEDYFNQSNPFKTIILTPNNRIREILSLNEEIFCKVYEEMYSELDRDTRNGILEYFEKLLYSKGEIPNFKLLHKRKEYLEQASKSINAHYISRKLKTNKFSFDFEDQNLLDLLKDNKVVLLLGEPGSGKTTELINISSYFEQNIAKMGITPIFISLANIKTCLEDALPAEWMHNKKIVLLLDALDEFELKSQLAAEIERLLSNKSISFKIIVTSRTYAYGDELKPLDPAVFYLSRLDTRQSFELLQREFDIPADQLETISKKEFKDALEDPFMLNILGKFYQNHAVLPQTTAQLYEDIKAELPADHLELYKAISLILELTKKTSVDKKELKNLLGLSYRKVKDLRFIESTFDNSSYKFIHKNYQEYFAASSLAELSFAQILDFISIQGVHKIHPTLFNTITFLINILQGEKYTQLLDWLLANNPELLIKADKNRIGDFRVQLFQNYFHAECIEKTFWISSAVFSIKEIAEFGDCEDNFDYLVSIIQDKDRHFRTIISALELLSHFTVSPEKKNDLKATFFKLLQNPDINQMIKSHILDCIADLMLCEGDDQYLGNIFELFKEETNKQLNRSLLSLIQYYPDIDAFFWYLKEEFLREKGITQRAVMDDVSRGTSWLLEEMILKFKKSSNFIAIGRYYFDEQNSEYRNSYFVEKLINRCLDFEDSESDFIVSLLSSFDDKTDLNLYDDTLKALVLKLSVGSQLLAFDYLISNMPFENINYFLGTVTSEENIKSVIGRFFDGTIDAKYAEHYRNVVANHSSRRLAQHFNDLMMEQGFSFTEKLLTEEEHAKLASNYKSFPQKNFDLLFSRTILLSNMENIFNEYGTSIDSALIRKIQTEWYHKNGHGGSIDISISIIRRLIHREQDAVKFEDIQNLLQDEFVLISEIQSQIKAINASKQELVITEEQKSFLNNWCITASRQIRFDRILRYVSSDRYGALEDYAKFKAVMFFTEKIDFDLDQDFLLNSLEFIDVNNSNEGDDKLKWLKLKINNDPLFTRQIISNITTKNLVFLPLNIHIQYALDNRLEDAYPKIREHFLMPDYNYNIEDKLKKYVDLTNDAELLKELCDGAKSHKFWSALKILMSLQIEQDFCEQKVIEYLEADIVDETNYYVSSALAILFELNSPQAIDYISKSLNKNQLPSLNTASFSDYNAVENYTVIEELFKSIYAESTEKYGFHGLTSFIGVYISNLSKTKQSYDLVQEVLSKIRSKALEQNSDTDLFHANHLIEKSITSYINAQSKALSFKEAASKIENL